MASKRGLSQVVTTVILILLVLAAIAIIWSFVRPVIESSSKGISSDCLTIGFEVECILFEPEITGVFNVSVTRTSGKGDLRDLAFIADGIFAPTSDASSPSIPYTYAGASPIFLTGAQHPPGPLETTSGYVIVISSDVNPPSIIGKKVEVGAIVGDDLRLCPPVASTICK